MPKKPSNNLFKLIKALSGNEKRYFKLQVQLQNTDKLFLLRLFEEIEGQVEYDEDVIYQNLEPIFRTNNNFRVQKRYCYSTILRTMRQYHAAQKNIDTDITNEIGNIRFLITKRLFEQAETILYRTKKACYTYQRYFHMISLLKLEYDLLNAKIDFDAIQQQSQALILEAKHVLEIMGGYFEMRNIDLQLQPIIKARNFQPALGESHAKAYEALIDAPLFSRKELMDNLLEAELIKFYIDTLWCAAKEIEDKGGVNAVHWNGLFKRYKEFHQKVVTDNKLPLFESLETRMSAFLYNYVRIANNTDIIQAREAVEILRNTKFTNESAIRGQRLKVIYMTLRFAFVEGNREEFERGLTDFNGCFPDISALPVDEVLSIYAKISALYLMFKEYHNSAEYLKRTIEINKVHPRVRIDIVEAAYLKLIVVYCMLKSKEKILESVESASKYIKQNRALNELEAYLLKFAQEFAIASERDREGLVIELVTNLKKIEHLKSSQSLISYFDFIGWFECLSLGTSFIAYIRKKNEIF